MISKNTQLETSRLVLKIPSLEEVPFIFSATRFEGFNDGMLWDPPKTEEPIIESYHRNIKAWEEGRGFSFSLYNKSNNDFIGRISIRKEEEKDLWNIGFWTHPEQQGNGYMTEAVSAVLAFGFESLHAQRIEACHALWNKASEKVLKKNGMTFIRYIEKGFLKKEKWIEENLLGINRSRWMENTG